MTLQDLMMIFFPFSEMKPRSERFFFFKSLIVWWDQETVTIQPIPPKSFTNSIPTKLTCNRWIHLKLYTKHNSNNAILCAKFQNDSLTKIVVIDKKVLKDCEKDFWWIGFQNFSYNVWNCNPEEVSKSLVPCLTHPLFKPILTTFKYWSMVVPSRAGMNSQGWECTGGRFDIKIATYHYRNSHYKDKMVSWASYPYNGNPYTWKSQSLYRSKLLNIFYVNDNFRLMRRQKLIVWDQHCHCCRRHLTHRGLLSGQNGCHFPAILKCIYFHEQFFFFRF